MKPQVGKSLLPHTGAPVRTGTLAACSSGRLRARQVRGPQSSRSGSQTTERVLGKSVGKCACQGQTQETERGTWTDKLLTATLIMSPPHTAMGEREGHQTATISPAPDRSSLQATGREPVCTEDGSARSHLGAAAAKELASTYRSTAL